ncbi:alternate-type signal peptide domain-containing protein [Rhodococcus sp. NPDC049939]|uniref:alternate-type signal peptide domain-containing protein n=1 Tax=Rhodococcus sp. NPDC049939 TaxID=3155511 RepID=UPI0033CA2EF3
MNKQTKGAIAAGAAAILLAGGAGTMAAWNASESVGGGSVKSGTLSLTQGENAGWKDSNGVAIEDIASFKAVPGDVLTYSAEFLIGAEGDNLSATLSADKGSISPDNALKEALVLETTATIGDEELVDGTIDSDDNGKTVSVNVEVSFEDAGNDTQGLSVDLSNFSVTLEQNSVTGDSQDS